MKFEDFKSEIEKIYDRFSVKRYDRDDWEIEDEDYLRFVDFEKIGKILSIVMKHLGRIELD